MLSLFQIVIGVILLGALLWRARPRSTPAPLPPGPPGDPFIGHVRFIPADNPHYAYLNWGKEYESDVLYFSFLGKPVVVLNSVKAATELLERRGAKYSGRPPFHFFEESGWKNVVSFMNPGPMWKKHRRLFQNAFTANECKKYHQTQIKDSRKLVSGLLDTPEKWENHIVQFSTSIIMGITYGKTITEDDPYLRLSEKIALALTEGFSSGATAVDVFPFIRRLPQWFTLIPSLNIARQSIPYLRAMRVDTFAEAKEDIETGTALPSFVSKMLNIQAAEAHEEKLSADTVTEEDIEGAAGTMYAAGQDTSHATLLVFVLAMVLHPEFQKKAWKEIDEVVGRDRMPTFEDRSSLPMVEHIMQEVLRWFAVVPLGVPHRSTEDDIYNGMFIPKGSMMLANAHAMSRDESTYHSPDTFNPDRYISASLSGAGEPFPNGPFGFGRRICPGRHLGQASVWMAIASILATLEICKPTDAQGNEITPKPAMVTGLTSHPEHFDCVFRPRFEGARELISYSL